MRLQNNKGIALITALMFTLITLVIIVGVLSMVNMSSKGGGAMKVYRNVTEASYGGVDIVTQDVIPRLFQNISTSTIMSDYNKSSFNKFMAFGSSACIRQKKELVNSGSNWSACNDTSINPKSNPDMTFKLTGVSNQSFTVYSKIVDTKPGVPYPVAASGSRLSGGGVTESSSGTTMNLAHYVYRIEVTGERSVNPLEQSNISVLYEY